MQYRVTLGLNILHSYLRIIMEANGEVPNVLWVTKGGKNYHKGWQ